MGRASWGILTLGIGAVVLVVLFFLSIFANNQRILAEGNAGTAIANEYAASTEKANAEREKVNADNQRATAVANADLALARQLAEKGWGLVIDARGKKALKQVAQILSEKTNVVAIPGDITTEAHRKKLAIAASELDGLDALVNNASLLGPSPQPNLLDYPLDVLEQVYRTNVIAPLGMLQELRSVLKLNACISNVTSDAGIEAYSGWGGYGSSKAALEHLSHIFAEENPSYLEDRWRSQSVTASPTSS